MAQKAPRAALGRRSTSQAAGARSSERGTVVTTQGGGSTVTINPGSQQGTTTSLPGVDDETGPAASSPPDTSPATPAPAAAAATGDEHQDDEHDESGDRPGSSGSSGGRGSGGGFMSRVYTRMEEPAGWLVALFAYPLAVNLLKGGPKQMWAWIDAKFTNNASGGTQKHHVSGNSLPGGQLPPHIQ